MGDVKSKNPTKTYPQRSDDAIAQRYRKAKCECLKLEGCIDRIKAKEPTGSVTESDILRAAQALCNGEANLSNMYSYLNDSTIDAGTEFPFLDCLWYLRQTISWKLIIKAKASKQNCLQYSSSPPREELNASGAGARLVIEKEDFVGSSPKTKKLCRNFPGG